MANTTDMMAVGSDALAEVRDWVKEKTVTDAALDQNSENAIQNKAVAVALQDYPKKADISGYLGAVLKITFDSEFAGQVYAVTGGGESFSGTVPDDLVVKQTVQPEGLTTYTISATATGEAEASAITQDVQFYGVYPVELHAVPPAPPFELVSWAEGTDEQIAALIAAADAGAVDLAADAGWKVGDIRTLTIGAMAATGVGETHAAQTVRLVLSHAGETAGITRADGGAMHFQVDQVDELSETGYMNASNTNAGSWEGSARRKWCNEVYHGERRPRHGLHRLPERNQGREAQRLRRRRSRTR